MKNMNINEAIKLLEKHILNPLLGLPEEIFFFVSRITPLVNVDLLIKNEQNQTLLTWRDDGFGPPGWHIPGGIIRYKETIVARVQAVATNELGVGVAFEPTPIVTNEIILGRRTRGHFISLLYQCRLLTRLDEKLKCKSDLPNSGEWKWHDSCPDNLIEVHDEMYRKYI